MATIRPHPCTAVWQPGFREVRLIVWYLPPMNTTATRRHWRVAQQAVEEARATLRLALGYMLDENWPKASIVCTRYSRSRKEGPDHENLAMSFKPWIDALTPSEWRTTRARGRYQILRAGLILSDSPSHLERTYQWKPDTDKGHIEMVVSRLE